MVILAGIRSLVQHVNQLQTQPDSYRPSRCPHCGKAGLWRHGSYQRQANRRGLAVTTDAPILIPRFLCRHCGVTCSCLPEAIPPRRWYLWEVQQLAVLLLLDSTSLNRVAQRLAPGRQTIKRWWQRLRSRFWADAAALRSRFAELGRYPHFESFWSNSLKQMPLSAAMCYLHHRGIAIP